MNNGQGMVDWFISLTAAFIREWKMLYADDFLRKYNPYWHKVQWKLHKIVHGL